MKDYLVVETKRHKPCLIYHGFRYVQDKIQNRTVYWRCEDRAHCNGRAHQLTESGALPVLTIRHNHPPIMDELSTNDGTLIPGQQRRAHLRTSRHQQQRTRDDLSLSSTSSTMTSPVKLENHSTRQQHVPNQHGPMVPNLHLSEVITTAAATNPHCHNGMGLHRQNSVDPIEMTKLLSNITTSSHSASKTIPLSSTMDYTSRLNHFSWEEIEGRYLPVVFRNENESLHRYTSKMFVENTLFQSESWQRHALLARSLPPLISFPYTDHELKLFRVIVEWHLASFKFKTILPSDCLIRFDDLLDFYGALRKLRDTSSTTSFTRPLPPPPIPPPMPLPPPPKQRPPPSSNGLGQSFKLPTMTGNSTSKSHRPSSSTKIFPPALHRQHSPNYLLQQNADLLASFCNSSAPVFSFNSLPSKSSLPVPPPTPQWTEPLLKSAEKLRPPLPRPMIPMSTPSLPSQEQISRDKHSLPPKPRQPSNPHLSRETKESGWVQINNVFVPYIVKWKLPRELELEKYPTRPPTPQLQREFYVPYEILIKCNIFSDTEFAFKKLLVKATQQDFDIFDSLISNINILDEKVPEKTFLVNLHHAMSGLQRILYVKFLTTKQPRSQVNKYHAEVLTHKGGTLLMHGNRLVPYIVQNNRSYVPLLYAYQTLPHVLSQAKRGARAPRQYEVDYLNLLFIYFSIDSPPLTSDTLLVDAFSIKSSDIQLPIHFRTLVEHQQYEKTKLLNTLMRFTQTNSKSNPETLKAPSISNSSSQKSNKYPPANVVVNPLIHHPSFYGLPSPTPSIKQPPPPSISSQSPPANPVVVNPFFFPPTTSTKKSYLKTIKYDNHSFNALIKSSHQSMSEAKISLRDIFQEFSFEINHEKFIQWCQNNLLLPLVRLDDEEKQTLSPNHSHEEFYVYHRHLNRCIELLNDLKRGTISMTLLPPPLSMGMNNETIPVKTQLAGAKKRKTTVPTTRHIHPPPPLQSSPVPNSISHESPSHSPELPINEEKLPENSTATMNSNDDDNSMPVVDTVEEEQSIPIDLNSSFIAADSNECEDGKMHLDDTLPSCSSGYESSAALTTLDVHQATQPSSSDDEETNSTTRSREHSSSCQSEQSQSLAPILSAVSSNIQLNSDEQDNNRLSPMLTNEKSLHIRLRTKTRQVRSRSRSPTPKANKKQRLSDSPVVSSAANTITSDQIEHHLRTLLMPIHEQKRTRTRPIKTPTRLVEEIPHSNHYPTKYFEPVERIFSPPPSTATTTTIDANTSEPNTPSHQSCMYNVTISNKPNKLGLTIKKVIPR